MNKENQLLKFKLRGFILFFFWLNIISGQIIEGQILDKESSIPLENVNIYLESNLKRGTVSDETGSFVLKINRFTQKPDNLIFSMIGYKTFKIQLSNLNENTNKILLSKMPNELDEVKLSAKRNFQSRIKYKKLSPMKKGVFAFSSVITGNILYVIGGDNTFIEDTFKKAIDEASMNTMALTMEAILSEWDPNSSWVGYSNNLFKYDIQKDLWKKDKIKFESRAYHQVNLYNKKLYVVGGKNIIPRSRKEYLHNKIEVFDIDSLQVKVDETNPHQAANFTSITYKDNLILMGGSTSMMKNGSKVFTNKIHQFNLTSGLWYEIGTMNKAKEVSGVIIKNKIYLIGGFDDKPLSEIESWDLITGKWKKEGELFYGIERPALAVYNDMIYIFDIGRIFTFDTTKNILLEYEINLSVKNANIHCFDDKLYILGGYRKKEYSKEPSSDLYVININEFIKTKPSKSENYN